MLDQIIQTFQEASPYLLLGLLFSAIIQTLVSPEKITRWIGQNNFRSVLVSAAAGVPMPLCSCGVIPMAMSLRKSGASRGATLAFLISTPETGLDSIMLSFALLNPVIAIFRPFAAFVTAMIAGVMENGFDHSKEQSFQQEPKKDCCGHKEVQEGWLSRIRNGFNNSFVTLLGEMAPWLIFGLVISGVISFAIPSTVIQKFLGGGGIGSMLIMLAIGIPLYICASASTPIAASLLLKGASPGVVLVFLLAGPATNVTTILMVYRFLGKRALIIYLSSISVCALGFGLLLNAFYYQTGIDLQATIGYTAHCVDHTWQIAAAIVLAVLIGYALIRRYLKD